MLLTGIIPGKHDHLFLRHSHWKIQYYWLSCDCLIYGWSFNTAAGVCLGIELTWIKLMNHQSYSIQLLPIYSFCYLMANGQLAWLYWNTKFLVNHNILKYVLVVIYLCNSDQSWGFQGKSMYNPRCRWNIRTFPTICSYRSRQAIPIGNFLRWA